MNTEPDHDGDAFERELARFQRTPVPEQWRDDLIANALPAQDSTATVERRTFRFLPRLPDRVLGGALAAAWLVIFALWITTPKEHSGAPSQTSPPRLDSAGLLSSDHIQILGWRFARNGFPEDLQP